jgi:hypothetical protein
MRRALLIAAFVGPVWCQSVSVGVLGGLQATGAFQSLGRSAVNGSGWRQVGGPALAVGLSHGVGIEFDALYRKQKWQMHYSYVVSSNTDETDDVWEFPLLGTFRIPSAQRVYLQAGWVPRTMHASGTVTGTDLDSSTGRLVPSSGQFSQAYPITHGFVIGGGFEITLGRLRFLPQARYTRWNSPAIDESLMGGAYATSSQNQLDVFIGIGARVRK